MSRRSARSAWAVSHSSFNRCHASICRPLAIRAILSIDTLDLGVIQGIGIPAVRRRAHDGQKPAPLRTRRDLFAVDAADDVPPFDGWHAAFDAFLLPLRA